MYGCESFPKSFKFYENFNEVSAPVTGRGYSSGNYPCCDISRSEHASVQ